MEKTVYALFSSPADVEAVTADLENMGIGQENISAARQQEEAKQEVAQDKSTRVKKTAVGGMEAGAVGGATAGLVGGIVLAVTGPLGLLTGVVAAAATTVGGSVVGAVTGSLVGALVGVGFPETVARSYEEGIKKNQTLFGVRVNENTEDTARQVLETHNGRQIHSLPVQQP